ncbi:hypothetical protein GW17_00017188 [Ensete ventricosum]|nr:hypothetical protein GW17_00017188 [Ensete ventricosum]
MLNSFVVRAEEACVSRLSLQPQRQGNDDDDGPNTKQLKQASDTARPIAVTEGLQPIRRPVDGGHLVGLEFRSVLRRETPTPSVRTVPFPCPIPRTPAAAGKSKEKVK